jgi:formamidopyrimidine-DNA glycosylase
MHPKGASWGNPSSESLASPFLLRTVNPALNVTEGRIVRELRRIGKRIAIGVEGDPWLVLHLMIAGRLHWRPPGAKLGGRRIRTAAKAGKSRHALRNIAVFAGRAYLKAGR